MKPRMLGTCVTFNGSYAFLRPALGDGKDVFVHESELPNGTIRVGDKCTFDVSPDRYKPNRLRATNVTLVDEGEKPDDAGAAPGMYAQPDTGNAALAEGLRKFIRNQQ